MNLEAGTEEKAIEEHHLLACSACSPIAPRTTSPGVPPIMDWTHSHKPLIKNAGFPTAQSYGDNVSIEVPSPQANLSLYQVDIKLSKAGVFEQSIF